MKVNIKINGFNMSISSNMGMPGTRNDFSTELEELEINEEIQANEFAEYLKDITNYFKSYVIDNIQNIDNDIDKKENTQEYAHQEYQEYQKCVEIAENAPNKEFWSNDDDILF